MKVLMVLDEKFPPDVRVENEMKTLMDAGHQITLLCYTRTHEAAEDKYGDARVIRVPISRMMYKMKALSLSIPFYFSFWKKHIRNALKTGDFEVIHVHDLPLLKPCLELAGKHGIKVIGDFHENRPEIMKMYHHVNSFPGNMLISINKWLNYQRYYSSKADYLILVTPEAKEYYHKEYDVALDRIYVVPNYTDPEKLLKIEPDPEIINRYKDKFTLTYLGNTGIRRGTRTIIEAARMLKEDKGFHFVIIGESSEQDLLKALVDQDGLTNVELPGYVPFQKAASYIMASKAGLCPFLRNIHHDTTYANKMFQYMAYGKAIIASDCTSQANVVNEVECGLVFKADDPGDLVEKIQALKDKDLLEKFAVNGHNAVINKYNTRMGNKALTELYNSIQEQHH
ncbi:MAG: glycosyltransferase family 4 protein [Bacteroidota bacterium]|nr:glycosyltransferase family 4 protein [Bacteroidota bacterium]